MCKRYGGVANAPSGRLHLDDPNDWVAALAVDAKVMNTAKRWRADQMELQRTGRVPIRTKEQFAAAAVRQRTMYDMLSAKLAAAEGGDGRV